jgi:alkylation response protein AidB-like acyl-CoA dehydrogenase
VAILSNDLTSWLDDAADALDTGAGGTDSVLPALAQAGLFGIGVPRELGGSGGDVSDAVDALSAVSERSLAAGFVFWGHRTFIEYLLQTPNEGLRDALLPGLIAGTRAGATGLSNAMKFLAGIEELQIKAKAVDNSDALIVDGKMPWVTNLRRQGFDVAAAISGAGHSPAFVAVLSSDDAGLVRSPDLDLMGMRATSTAAVDVKDVRIGPDRILHANATEWLPRVRPAFLGLQCGMSVGLARRALDETKALLKGARSVLTAPHAALVEALDEQDVLLRNGLRTPQFFDRPADLFGLRICLAEIATDAVQLELQASGGKAYLSKPGQGFQRRLREVAFIPLITPSLVQLKTVLQSQQQAPNICEVA